MKVSSLSPCGSRRAKLALRGLGRGVHTGGPDAAKVHTGSPDAATPLPDPPPQGGREQKLRHPPCIVCKRRIAPRSRFKFSNSGGRLPLPASGERSRALASG